MNLKQLINSTKRTVSYMFDTKKDFTQKPLGQVIAINTDEAYDSVRGILHMVMYITAVTQKYSAIQLYDKPDRRKKEIYKEPKRQISTHTVGITFKDHYRLTLSLSEISQGAFSSMEDEKFESHIRGKASEDWGKRVLQNRKISYSDYLEQEDEIIEHKLKNDEQYRKFIVNKSLRELIEGYLTTHPEVLANMPKLTPENFTIVRDSENNPITNGDDITISTPLTLDDEVRVRCTCAHFYYTYAWYNADRQALIGDKPPAYNKVRGGWVVKSNGIVTDRNVNQVPGICKHLQYFISYLVDKGIIRSSKDTSRVASYLKSQDVKDKLADVEKYNKLLSKDRKEQLLNKAQDELRQMRRDMNSSSREADLYRNQRNRKKR